MINIKIILYLVMLVAIGTTCYSVFQKQQEIHGVATYKEIIHEELDSIIALHNRYSKAIISLEGAGNHKTYNSFREEQLARLINYKDLALSLYSKLVTKDSVMQNSYSLSNSLCLSHPEFIKSHADSLYFGTSFSSSCKAGAKLHIDVNGYDMSDVNFRESISMPLNDSITITTTKMQINDRQRIDTTSAKQLFIYQNSAWIESLP